MPKRKVTEQVKGYSVAAVSVVITTAIIFYTHIADSSLIIVPLLYLLAVQAVAFGFGSRAAVLASFLAFLASDWFFVEPRYQFTIRDPFEFVALCVFLVTAITIGQLTALFHNRAAEAQRREIAATALAESSWTVASELDARSALTSVLKHLEKIENVKQAAILLRDSSDAFPVVAASGVAGGAADESRISQAAISHVLAQGTPIGLDGRPHWDKALGLPALYLPVILDGRCVAILFVELLEASSLNEADRQVVESIGNHVAVVLQRDKLVKEQANAQALVETDKLKTALLQMVSHDFRSPLSSIKVSVGSLIDDEAGDPLDRETRMELLETIESEADRLNKMVGNILDLSRLETGNWSPRRELSVVADIIGATLDAFTEEQNKRIQVHLDRSANEISIDPVQIVQVLKNLLENALKYSSPEKTIELETAVSNSSFIIRVLDRGSGLPQGEENRIFDPFYRAPKYRETSTPGVGMGLAIARGLVEAHGATLSARNREGGGAVFEVVFPDILGKVSIAQV